MLRQWTSAARCVRWWIVFSAANPNNGASSTGPPLMKMSAKTNARNGASMKTPAMNIGVICVRLSISRIRIVTAPAERGAYYRWMFFAAGPLESAATNLRLGVTVGPDQQRMVGYGSLEAVLDVLEGAVSASPFIAGERFSAADVYCGCQLGFLMQFGTIEKRPAFAEYWARIADRPAAVRAREIDDALIAKK